MKGNKTTSGILYFFLIIIFIFLNGCNKPVNIQSKWLDRKIVIDADDKDWMGYPYYYDEKTRSCIGIYNDNENLYLCFQTMDKGIQREILGRGLYIWFNKTGKKDKKLGICFPSGRRFGRPGDGHFDRTSGMPGHPPDMPSNMSSPPGDRPDDQMIPQGRSFTKGPAQDKELKIFSSEDDRGYTCNLEKAARFGIEVRYTIDQRNRFIYELKMPILEKDYTPFFTERSSLNQIGMGIMTSNMKKRSRSGGFGRGGMDRGGRGGGDMPGGDMPGGEMWGGRAMPGGGMGGGGMRGGGHMRGGEEGSTGNLEIWTVITLATKPANIN